MCKISVIMGVYNSKNKQLLKESIYSIINQTYKDWEFIICDDGSRDDTYEYIKEITNFDNRIKLIKNNKNLGLAATLNKCIRISKGTYIARQDADDISIDTRLVEQKNFLEKNIQYDLVGSSVYLISDNKIWGVRKMKLKPQIKDFLWGSQFVHPSVMFKREPLLGVGCYRVSQETIRGQDYDLFMRMYSNGSIGYNIPEKLLKFTENIDSYKRKKYKYRIAEAIIRYKGFKKLNLLPKGYLFILKPLIIGLIPSSIQKYLRNLLNNH